MEVFQIILVFIVLLGAFSLAYHIFKMTKLDAMSRGFKHPRFWGMFALGQNSGGLIMYMLGRRKYPSNMSKEDQILMNSYKNRIGICLIFITIGTIGLVLSMTLF